MEEIMNSTSKVFKFWPIMLLLSIMTTPGSVWTQEKEAVTIEQDTLIAIAREIIEVSRYCALITVDANGHPQARTMDPFPPDENMIIWLATNPKSRKVREIRNDPRVTLYYADPGGSGYVTIAGIARLVDDPKQKARWWKEGWESFFTDREENYILIRVTPRKLDILSYKHGITGDPVTWRAPSIEFKAMKTKD